MFLSSGDFFKINALKKKKDSSFLPTFLFTHELAWPAIVSLSPRQFLSLNLVPQLKDKELSSDCFSDFDRRLCRL